MYPDVSRCTIKGRSALSFLSGAAPEEDINKWYEGDFIPPVQQRGAAIIGARGASSAASAANACLMHARDWELGTSGKTTSMAVLSKGEYDIAPGLFYSFPVRCADSEWSIVSGLDIDEFSRAKMKKTEDELKAERDAVKEYLP